MSKRKARRKKPMENVGTDEIGSRKRPQWYNTTMTLPETIGEVVTQAINITLENFTAKGITWEQSAFWWVDPGVPPAGPNPLAGFVLLRDGMFRIELRTTSRIYQNQPIMIRAFAGDTGDGRFLPFPKWMPIDPKETFEIKLTNLIDRTGFTAVQREVDICIVGVTLLPAA